MSNAKGGRPPGTPGVVAKNLGEDPVYVRTIISRWRKTGTLPGTIQAHRVANAYLNERQAELDALKASIIKEAVTDFNLPQ